MPLPSRLGRVEAGGSDEGKRAARTGGSCDGGGAASRQDAVSKKLHFTPGDVDAPHAQEAGPEEEEGEEEVGSGGLARLDLSSLVPYYLEAAVGRVPPSPQHQGPEHQPHAPAASDLRDPSTQHHPQHGLLGYYVPDWRGGGAQAQGQAQGHSGKVAETAQPCPSAPGCRGRKSLVLLLVVCLLVACGRKRLGALLRRLLVYMTRRAARCAVAAQKMLPT
jgi:hypothetical protein